jgi:hypothetical protein
MTSQLCFATLPFIFKENKNITMTDQNITNVVDSKPHLKLGSKLTSFLHFYSFVLSFAKIFSFLKNLIFLVELQLELRASCFQSRTFTLAFHLSSFCSGYFGDGGVVNYLLKLASNHDPPHRSLTS